ncbi:MULTISPECIES: collagen-like protein [Wolbachia]|uniref:Collagen-like protein n=1 Tax=Wolbachia pipientis TaxID=955 RepID=A0A7G5CBS1_WOLPI|nr:MULTISPECIES: collagen-like protein [Wolbachia]MDE5061592.1 collagen-like protein [Wolbachia endosymbiont of Drosophila nikananu]QMV46655.1 collagen-like protein [Wolbachia pipientis]
MALSDKLSTIEDLATNGDFLGKLITELSKGANNADIYTKKGVDDELKKKADTAALTNKTDKNYVDTELRKKANTADVYTKKNVDDELAKKADTAALTNKADKNYVNTELGKKADISALDNKANTADVYTKTDADTAFVKATELKTKVAEKAVVDSITASSDFTDKVYTKTAADTAFVKTADLKTKAAEKDVVEAIFDAKDGNDKISETKVGTTFAKKTDLDNKADADGTNLDDAKVTAILNKLADKVVQISQLETPAVAGKVLGVKDGNKSILVDKLGGFLSSKETAPYDGTNNQTAKVFLAAKGITPTAADLATEVAKNAKFIDDIEKIAVSSNPKFQSAVREVMSQPSFEIPTSDDAALNWTW